MARRIPRHCSVTETLDASPEAVWAVVADPTRIGEWSDVCRSGEWLDGSTAMVPGARFRGRNSVRWVRWSRPCVVIESEATRRLVYDTVSRTDRTRWSITLDPAPDGTGRTDATLSFEIVAMARPLAAAIAVLIPEHLDRAEGLRADLRRLGAASRRG